jgi:hypothetical protein
MKKFCMLHNMHIFSIYYFGHVPEASNTSHFETPKHCHLPQENNYEVHTSLYSLFCLHIDS